MRASCETDLARRFPLATVAKWLGNTQAVALRHYVDVTDADFQRAASESSPEIKAAQNAAQSSTAGSRLEQYDEDETDENALKMQYFANSSDTIQAFTMEAAGIEPASRGAATQASTCVVGLLSRPTKRPPRVRFRRPQPTGCGDHYRSEFLASAATESN